MFPNNCCFPHFLMNNMFSNLHCMAIYEYLRIQKYPRNVLIFDIPLKVYPINLVYEPEFFLILLFLIYCLGTLALGEREELNVGPLFNLFTTGVVLFAK